jgi:type I restriction enzyme S subunit
MPSEWRDSTLGELVAIQRGHDLTENERRVGLVPVLGSAGRNGFHDSARSVGPGVVIGRSGASFGKVHYCAEDFWPHNTVLYVTDFRGNSPRFVYYCLQSIDLSHYNSGSAQQSLNRNYIAGVPLRIPPVAEQSAIARVLGAFDDKIHLNRRMSETLEAMARALFKSWFVNFDPVRAKTDGRDPGLPNRISALFPDRLIDSESRCAPEGWPVVPLPELISVNPQRRLRKGEVAPYLDMGKMPTQTHAPGTELPLRAFGSGMRFMNGDTLVARITPCLENGKTAFVDFLAPGEIAWGSTEYIVLRPKAPLPEEFAYCLARSDLFRDFAIQSMTGSSGRQRVRADSLDHFLLAAPPAPVAEAFGQFARPLFARAAAAVRESRTLAALRDTLLPKLISGELRVKDAERLAVQAGV